ncbi:MAG: right-handed parallel beta-helix repeat-containing protein, partial [Deltaproteobacteria bacterium]
AYGGQEAVFDTDYDGMEDWWEILWGFDPLDPSDASGNPDGDDYTNLDEFNNDTDPYIYDYPQNVWFVDADATGAGTGTSWADAFNIIQDALDAASWGEMVWIAEGTYISDSMSPVLTMKAGVEIYGGFTGTETELSERGNPTDQPTILDGEDNTNYPVVLGSSYARVDGFNITDGNINVGSGMYNENVTSLVVANCTFSDNQASIFGGGMYNWNSSPEITNCIFIGNSASDGGGIYNNNYSSPIITNCTFAGNSAVFGFGGGMSNWNSSSPILTNCILWDDSPDEISGGTPIVTYSDIKGSYTGIGNINADPLFIDPIAKNFHLQPTSPCIDAGDPDPAYNDPDGSRNDMGAYGGQNAVFDTDYDGMEDWWESLWGFNPLDPSDASENPDGDSLTNLDEFNNGTDPFTYTPDLWYVDADATGANTGLSWWDAFTNIKDALDAAPGGSMIWVAEGTYTSDSMSPVLTMKAGVKIYGGFTGTESNLSERGDPADHLTILNGEDTSYHVVVGASNSRLDGFIVTGGNAIGGGGENKGGGIFNDNVIGLVMANCVFSNNSAYYPGGGMYNRASSPEITNCTFIGNSSNSDGGGMSNCLNSSPTITNCTFFSNSAGAGGGMCNYENSSPIITNCAFIGNSATWVGGGMYNYENSSPIITNCTFIGNLSDSEGGGMYNGWNSSPIITNCTFARNLADSNGGGMYNWESPTITNCIMWSNFPNEIPDFLPLPVVTYSNIDQDGYAGSNGNIREDPLFIAPSAGNFHLQPTSPCIDAGDPDPAYNDPDGSRNDMGAYGGQEAVFDTDYDGMEDW